MRRPIPSRYPARRGYRSRYPASRQFVVRSQAQQQQAAARDQARRQRAASDAEMHRVAQLRSRTWPTANAVTRFDYQVGRIEYNSGRAGSKLEDTVMGALRAAGLAPQVDVSVRVPDVVAGTGRTWLCTPDAIVDQHRCIEVDSSGYGPMSSTHNLGFPARDLYRDDCLRAVGFEVIRLRLGGLEAVPDTTNVLTSGDQPTRAVLAELVRTTRTATRQPTE